MTTLQSTQNSPRAGTSAKHSEIEMTAVREDSASVHGGRAFSQANLCDRYETSAHASETPSTPEVPHAPVPHAPVAAGALARRLAVVNGLQKRRTKLQAEKKTLNEKIATLQKLDVPASRLWEEYALHRSAFREHMLLASACTLSIVGFPGTILFVKGAYEERTTMNLVRQVLEAGGPQALLDTLQTKLDQNTRDFKATTDQLDAA